MKRIETSIDKVKNDIQNFYRPDQHHFVVINAVDLGNEIEIQWFFSDYAPPYEITTFCARIKPDMEIPSMTGIIESAWVAESELADLMDIKIENTKKGFVLEPDFETGPLRKKK